MNENETKAIAWVLDNTLAKDEEEAKWITTLWYTEALSEYTQKDYAHSILDGSLTIETAFEYLVELIESENEEEVLSLTEAKIAMEGYF